MAYGKLIDARTVAEHLDERGWIIFDCRFTLTDPSAGYRAYEAGHIPGAAYAHLDEHLAGPAGPDTGRHPLPDPDVLAAWLGHWGVTPAVQVVAYDDSGGAIAARLWWLLRWLGHSAVAVLDGGYAAWCDGGFAITREVSRPSPASAYPGQPEAGLWVSTQELAHALDSGAVQLIDVRGPERYRGEHEPVDPVAGHIPGAVNLPFDGNLAPSGRFWSPQILRARYRRALGPSPAARAVVMCGSGVTACHGLLAMAVAGLEGGRLYPGSFSEWIRDPSRPVVSSG